MDEWSEWPIEHLWIYLYRFKILGIILLLYVHIKKLSLCAAVVANLRRVWGVALATLATPWLRPWVYIYLAYM